jgi:phage baseplate assembly protein W
MRLHEGRHLSFPFHIGSDGRAAQVQTLDEHVRDELIQLILTNTGERLFLPEFGGGARRLVFENIGEMGAGILKAKMSQAIASWLGERLTVEDLAISVENVMIEVEIKYRILGTETTRIARFQRISD